MKTVARAMGTIAVLGLLVAACNSATGPKLPDPKDPVEPRDSIPPGTAAVPAGIHIA